MVDVTEKRVSELEEMLKDSSSSLQPTQKIITPGYERVGPTGVEAVAEREQVVCPDCLSENFILPGSETYKCEICNKTQRVTR